MNRLGVIGSCATAALVAALSLAPAQAKVRRGGGSADGGVPELNVKSSCSDAQKFSSGDEKNTAYKGCMQDETNAKDELKRRWSSFKAKDRSNCVEQARFPSPSYVEVLTCLEMDADAMRNTPQGNSKPVPQIGGPLAPGLTGNPTSPAPGGGSP